MECRAGCSDCCRCRLSVPHVEAAAIRRGLADLEVEARHELAARARDTTREMCPALDDQGRCGIYAFRPLLCRTFGVPLRHTKPEQLVHLPVLDVCDKNFREIDLKSLADRDVLDHTPLVDRLTEIDREYCEPRGLDPAERIPIAQILGDTSAVD